MNDQKMKAVLTSYIRKEMSLICETQMPGYDHTYSKNFNKRIRRMFWSEKYFGKKLHVGYAVRRIAIVALIILSLFTVNEVSARVFGFNPWNYLTSFLSDSKMEVKTYKESGQYSGVLKGTEHITITKDVPESIPEGFERASIERGASGLYVEWCRSGKEYLQYSRTKLVDSIRMATDGEYDSKEKTEIHGFVGNYCVKGDETWIIWDDTSYNHIIVATGVKDSKKLLKEMAESLYQ